MVLTQAINGADDTWTPTLSNLVCFWAVEMPLVYTLAPVPNWCPPGGFWSVTTSETLLVGIAIWVFHQGRRKTIQL
jgi:Na+-driven multidrug efflux pump